MNENNYLKYFDFSLLAILFLSLTIFPNVKVSESLYIGIEDMILPIILFRIAQSKMYFFNKYVFLMLIFGAYIFFTIAINNRLWSLRDYFEIFKIGKFMLIVFFTRHVLKDNFLKFDVLVKITFVGLLIFNFAHYFNVFNFNKIIEPFYATSEIHLSTFGLDSLGRPAVRRMMGTMGNPNINAILFLFFFVYFLSKSTAFSFRKENIFIYLSFLCIIVTQSRTGFISGVSAYIFWIIFTKQKLKTTLINTLFLIATFFIAFAFNSLALTYFSNTSANIIENNSVLGRLEVWKFLMKMIEQKPIFGYGPNKDFFYNNNLYAESEYVLYMWRYGFIGLILYFGWLLLPLYKAIVYNKFDSFYILFAVIIGINAITNCPLSDPKILLFFAISIGYYYAKIDKFIKLKDV